MDVEPSITDLPMTCLSDFGLKEICHVYGSGNNSFTDASEATKHINFITGTLKKQENKLMAYCGTSPQIAARKEVIEWMKTVADDMELLQKTLYHGVYLFDRFSDNHDISLRQIHLVALACLYLSAKLEENDGKGARMRFLKKYLPEDTQYTESLFLQIENFVLQHFDWNILSITVVDFTEYYLMFGIESDEVPFDENNNMAHKMLRQLSPHLINSVGSFQIGETTTKRNTKLIQIHVLKLAGQVYKLLDDVLSVTPTSLGITPSIMAATAVLYGRCFYGLRPWTENLQLVSQYTEKELLECLNNYIIPNTSLPDLVQRKAGDFHLESKDQDTMEMTGVLVPKTLEKESFEEEMEIEVSCNDDSGVNEENQCQLCSSSEQDTTDEITIKHRIKITYAV